MFFLALPYWPSEWVQWNEIWKFTTWIVILKPQIGWAPLKLPETAQLVTSQEFSIPNPFPQTKRLEKIGDVIKKNQQLQFCGIGVFHTKKNSRKPRVERLIQGWAAVGWGYQTSPPPRSQNKNFRHPGLPSRILFFSWQNVLSRTWKIRIV